MDLDNMIEFIMDPLRLTLIVAGVVVFLAILILGRRSNKQRDMLYHGSSRKDYSFDSMSEDRLVDEEVIVLPRRKTESELFAESHFSANDDDQTASELESFGASSLKDVSSLKKVVSQDNSFDISTQTVQSHDNSVEAVDKQDVAGIPRKIATKQSTEDLNTRSSRNQSVQTKSVQTQNAQVQHSRPQNSQLNHSKNRKSQTESSQVIQPAKAQPSKPKKPKQQFVVLYVVAPKGHVFHGRSIFSSTQTLGMALGKHSVFHYPADSAYVGDSAFCMTNMSAEGNFDIENLDEIQTNGVSLILTLPTIYSDGLTVFSNMLAVAQALAKKLGGDIIDQAGMPLTAEVVTNMRSDIEKFEQQAQAQSLVPEI